jgi:DNA-3-methyladenine glycosylase
LKKQKRLPREFFRRDPQTVAQQLLGQRLVRQVEGTRVSGLIVETEAYLGVIDKAAHSFGGRRTKRTETMYADGGTAYVYLNYGIHHLFNVVTDSTDVPTAVLIRAIEPTEGLERMQANRPAARSLIDLCNGPGKVAAALEIDRSHDQLDLVTSAELFLEQVLAPTSRIVRAPRIGVDYAAEWARRKLRFYLRGSPFISRK